MSDDVQRIASRTTDYRERYSDIPNRRFDFAPGEDDEEDAQPSRFRRGALRRGILLLTIIGFGWMIYSDPSRIGRWWSTASTSLAPIVEQALDQALQPAPPVDPMAPVSSGNIAVASTSPTLRFAAPSTQDVKPTPEAPLGETTKVEPSSTPDAPKVIATLPPVRSVASPADARQKPSLKRDRLVLQAQSAGLHPKLSRVLLAKLSKTDFRNARYAIRTALEKTSDDAAFTWPRKRKSGRAIFEVRFVAGAAKECRRYVVTIEKERWLTTALPMEKCGTKPRKVDKG